MQSLISVSEVRALEEEALAHKKDVVLVVEAEVSVLEKVASETEGPVLNESVAPKVKMEVSFVSLGTLVLTSDVVERSIPAPDLFMEHNQPSPYLLLHKVAIY